MIELFGLHKNKKINSLHKSMSMLIYNQDSRDFKVQGYIKCRNEDSSFEIIIGGHIVKVYIEDIINRNLKCITFDCNCIDENFIIVSERNSDFEYFDEDEESYSVEDMYKVFSIMAKESREELMEIMRRNEEVLKMENKRVK